MTQYCNPDQDVSIAGWLASPSGSPYYDNINDYPDNTAYIYCQNSTPQTARFGLETARDPFTSSGHAVMFSRRKSTTATTGYSLNVYLYCGSTLIKSITGVSLATTFAILTTPLTTGEANSITDYSNLELRFQAAAPAGARVEIGNARFYCPNPGWSQALSGGLVTSGDLVSEYQSGAVQLGGGLSFGGGLAIRLPGKALTLPTRLFSFAVVSRLRALILPARPLATDLETRNRNLALSNKDRRELQ